MIRFQIYHLALYRIVIFKFCFIDVTFNVIFVFCPHIVNLLLLSMLDRQGGFISSDWLNKPEPLNDKLKNVSLRKYLPWIQYWGGWGLFQEMLSTLDVISKKYSVSISNVAVGFITFGKTFYLLIHASVR